MSDEDMNINDSLWRSLVLSGELRDLSLEISEVALDAVMEEGIIKNIPILGSIYKIAQAGVNFRNNLFAKKILKFLTALDAVSQEERQAQIDRLEADPKERQKIGENLMLLLDKLSNMDKPQLLARAFQALLEAKITLAEFYSLANAVDAVNQEYLQKFVERCESKGFDGQIPLDAENANFLQAGLLMIGIVEAKTVFMEGKPATYSAVKKTELTMLFYEHILKRGN